jgi:hypothetical protein
MAASYRQALKSGALYQMKVWAAVRSEPGSPPVMANAPLKHVQPPANPLQCAEQSLEDWGVGCATDGRAGVVRSCPVTFSAASKRCDTPPDAHIAAQ